MILDYKKNDNKKSDKSDKKNINQPDSNNIKYSKKLFKKIRQ